MIKRAIIVDGSSMIYRCFYAMESSDSEQDLSKKKSGFLSILSSNIEKWKKRQQYSCGAVVFDIDRKSFRNEIFPEYKGDRPPMPEDLLRWMPDAISSISALGIKVFHAPYGFEADDLIGTLARKLSEMDYRVDIFSTDRDLFQLVDYLISVYRIKKSFQLEENNHLNFLDWNEGLLPFQIPFLKALSGDTSDNYPGVPGIGQKTAVKLIKEYKTISRLFSSLDNLSSSKIRDSLFKNRELFEKCLQLATIKTDIKFKYSFSEIKIRDEDNSGAGQSWKGTWQE